MVEVHLKLHNKTQVSACPYVIKEEKKCYRKEMNCLGKLGVIKMGLQDTIPLCNW